MRVRDASFELYSVKNNFTKIIFSKSIVVLKYAKYSNLLHCPLSFFNVYAKLESVDFTEFA